MGGDPLELGRRAALIGQANSEDQVAIDQFEASISDLTAHRNEMHAARTAQARTLRLLTDRRRTLDTLARLARAGRGPRRGPIRAGRRDPPPAGRGHLPGRDPAHGRRPDLGGAFHTRARTRGPPPQPAPPAGSGGVSPYHDQPFLVCTRAAGERRRLRRGQCRRRLLRRLPVRAHDLERHGFARRPARPDRRPCRRGRRSPTRTNWRGRSTSGKATRPGAVAASGRSRRTVASVRTASGVVAMRATRRRGCSRRVTRAEVGRRQVEQLRDLVGDGDAVQPRRLRRRDPVRRVLDRQRVTRARPRAAAHASRYVSGAGLAADRPARGHHERETLAEPAAARGVRRPSRPASSMRSRAPSPAASASASHAQHPGAGAARERGARRGARAGIRSWRRGRPAGRPAR